MMLVYCIIVKHLTGTLLLEKRMTQLAHSFDAYFA